MVGKFAKIVKNAARIAGRGSGTQRGGLLEIRAHEPLLHRLALVENHRLALVHSKITNVVSALVTNFIVSNFF